MTARLEWLTDEVLQRALYAHQRIFQPGSYEAMRRVLEAAAQEAETPRTSCLTDTHYPVAGLHCGHYRTGGVCCVCGADRSAVQGENTP